MLLFYALDGEHNLDGVRRRGLRSDATNGLHLYRSLDAAERAASGPILVVNPAVLGNPVPAHGDPVHVPSVPASAVQNVDPYRPPQAVAAAGGYVGCPLPRDVAVLLIHRRGVWDLPKGKQDPDEDLEACAVREVREEIGIDDLHVIRTLGTTQHGYSSGEVYAVKTTNWFLMSTSERSFRPERREGIRRVACARWTTAYRHVGYDNLRQHMDRVEADVRAAFS